MSFFAALALFAIVAMLVAAVRAHGADHELTAADAEPRRAPQPGARDRYSLAAPTLGRAPVPSWG